MGCSRGFMIGERSAGVRTGWTALVPWLVCWRCAAARTASAADCPGHPDALGTSRTLVVDPRETSPDRHHAISRNAAAQDHEVVLTFDDGPLPRNSDQVLANSRLAMREGDLLHDRPAGASQSGRRAQAARRRPHRRHPHPESSADHEQDADRARQAGDRRRHRLGEGGARRRRRNLRRSFAFPACCAPKASRTIWRRRASRSGARIFRPTTGAISRRSASTISRSSGSRPREKAFCCCTTFSPAPWPHCQDPQS